MHTDGFNLDDAIEQLQRTPAILSGLLGGMAEHWSQASRDPAAWSPFEVLVHLILGEQTNWIPRAKQILAGHGQPFEPFVRMEAAPEDATVDGLLATFGELRRANLATLAEMKLTSADLRRTGHHPEFGEVQLGQLLATWVVHDLDHLAQIIQTLAQRHTEAVGPWRAYLAILPQD